MKKQILFISLGIILLAGTALADTSISGWGREKTIPGVSSTTVTDSPNGISVNSGPNTSINGIEFKGTDENNVNHMRVDGDSLGLSNGQGNAVQIHGIANGASPNDAVNQGQLATESQNITSSMKTYANAAVGSNAVTYDKQYPGDATSPADYQNITLGNHYGANESESGGQYGEDGQAPPPVGIHNVRDGIDDHDAANVGQVVGVGNAAVQQSEAYSDAVGKQAVQQANGYTDFRINQAYSQFNHNLQRVKRRSYDGIAGAMAMANMPQAQPGHGSLTPAIGTYGGRASFALGVSYVTKSGMAFKSSLSVSQGGRIGAGSGMSIPLF